MKISRRMAYFFPVLATVVVAAWIFGVLGLPVPSWISKGMEGDPTIVNEPLARTVLKVYTLLLALSVSNWLITLRILRLRALPATLGYIWRCLLSRRGAFNVCAIVALIIMVHNMSVSAGASSESYFVKIQLATVICAALVFLRPPVGIVLGSSVHSTDVLAVTGSGIFPLRTVHLLCGPRTKRMIEVTPNDNLRTISGRAWRATVKFLVGSVPVIVVDGRCPTEAVGEEWLIIQRMINQPRFQGLVIIVTNDNGTSPLLDNEPEADSPRCIRVRIGELQSAVSHAIYE